MSTIGIIDYNAGNIPSVARALDLLNIEYIISKNPKDLENSKKLIFPGVGEARYAMSELAKTGFDSFLKDKTAQGIPLLGICLGSQIIFDYSEEGDTTCLGLLKGKIRHFAGLYEEEGIKNPSELGLKIPHMGWNSLEKTAFGKSDTCTYIFDGTPENGDVYFVHSYAIQPEDSSIIAAVADYGVPVPSVIKSNNITAFQFHPEKSGEVGLRLLKNFALEAASC